MSVEQAKKPRLPIFNGEAPSVMMSTSGADGMLDFLEEPGGPFMTPRIGQEVVTARRPAAERLIEVTRGETYPAPGGGRSTGGRYLMRDAGGRIIGALNFTLRTEGRRQQAVASNVAVATDRRRQGVASALFDEFVKDYPGAQADSSMTTDGAAFMGYGSAQGAPAAREASLRKMKP